MPRSRSRSPRGEFMHIYSNLSFLFNLDRYGSNRYRGGAGAPPNSGSVRRRNSRSRSPRDRGENLFSFFLGKKK